MKVHSNFTGPKSKKRLIAFSCATALASFAFIARPAFAEEAKADNSSNLDVTAATTANVETTADLVETKVVEAPATTENVASTENTTNVSEQASTSTASSETASETASTTASESQAPAESATGQTRDAVTTDRAANETASVPNETNVTGGQYYSDDQGNWYYKDASGKNLVGEQTIDGQNVYFRSNGQQVKGPLLDRNNNLFRYYDVDTGQLWTNRYLESQGNWYYLGKDGYPLTGEQTINGVKVYFDDFTGIQVKGHFAPNGKYYDKDSGALVTNAFKEILTYIGRDDINNQNVYTTAWYYLDADGKPLTGPQTFGNSRFYFLPNGAQVKGRFAPDGHYYDKNSGALVTDSFVHVYNWNYRNLDGDRIFHFTITIPGNDLVDQDGQYPRESKDLDREDFYYYVDAKGDKLTGPQTLNGIHVYFDQNGKQLRGEFKFDDDGTVHYYDAKNGARAENTIVRTNTGAFKFDADGNGHLMGPDEV